MATPSKNKDSTVRVWGRFWNADSGDPVDPDPLTITVESPGEDETETFAYPTDDEIVRVEAGVFYLKMPLLVGGKYRWKWMAYSVGSDEATAVIGQLDSVSRGSL